MIQNTISTATIEAIISRNEIIDLIETNKLDKENLVLVSISEPHQDGYEDEALTDMQVQGFKDSIRVKFWDIEEDFGKYKIISDEVAKQLQGFIINHKDDQFIVHCKAGQSRSAGVGKAIECIKYFGTGDTAKYNYQTSFNSEIDKHPRYSPNLTVFDKIVKD
jgi:predicted protein tyrosine phosphatase